MYSHFLYCKEVFALKKRILSLLLALVITLSSALTLGLGVSAATVDLDSTGANVSLAETAASAYGLCEDVQDGQILQCWC